MQLAMRWLLLSLLLIGAASAGDLNQDQVLQLRQAGQIVSLEEVLELAYQRHPGARLLEAELDEEDGQLLYELELLTVDGQVRELEFDARNASLLKDEED